MITLVFPEQFTSLIFPQTATERLVNKACKMVMTAMHDIHVGLPHIDNNGVDPWKYCNTVYTVLLHTIHALGNMTMAEAEAAAAELNITDANSMLPLFENQMVKTLWTAGICGVVPNFAKQDTPATMSEKEEAVAVSIDELPDMPVEPKSKHGKRCVTKGYTRHFRRGMNFDRIPDGKRLDKRQRPEFYLVCYDSSLTTPIKVYPAKQTVDGKAVTDLHDEYIREVMRKYHTESGCKWQDVRIISKAVWNRKTLQYLCKRHGKSVVKRYINMK